MKNIVTIKFIVLKKIWSDFRFRKFMFKQQGCKLGQAKIVYNF